MTWNELSTALSFGGARKKKAKPNKVPDEKPKCKPKREEIMKHPRTYGIYDYNKELFSACGVNWQDFQRFVDQTYEKLVHSGLEVSKIEVRHMIIAQYLIDKWQGHASHLQDIFNTSV